MDKEVKYFQERYGLYNLSNNLSDSDDIWFQNCRGFEDIVLSRQDFTISLMIDPKGDRRWLESKEYSAFKEGRDICLENYFRNWRSPTPEEKSMFEMIYGVELFWSEDNPFVWPSEEDLK